MYLLCAAALRNFHISLFFFFFYILFKNTQNVRFNSSYRRTTVSQEEIFVDLLNKETILVMWASLKIGWILEDLFYYNIAINDIWDDKIILFVMPFFWGNHLMHVLVLHVFVFISLTDSSFLIQQTSVDKYYER